MTFTPPKGVANAALYLHVEGGGTAARAVLAAGTSGSMLTVQTGVFSIGSSSYNMLSSQMRWTARKAHTTTRSNR